MTMLDTRRGDSFHLGATWDGHGTNFAVFSSAAAYGGEVKLCLLHDSGEQQVPMTVDDDVWHVYVAGIGPGQLYGYRASAPDLAGRARFDPSVLLLDPYAQAMTPIDPARPRLLRGLVVDPAFDWGNDEPLRRPCSDTVLYETHVKGITATHPDVPELARGTFAGLTHPAVLQHLVDLGITAVELMPVHQFLSEQVLLDRSLSNYWGYSTIGFFAPHAAYSSAGSRGQQVTEFKRMVTALHTAGVEVILDVVYNHTAEGPAEAPALCFRGLADDVYYRHDPAGAYIDTTGTGNSLDLGRPEVLRLVLDSLRYWVTEMHVDGFRFDLAAELARQHGYFDRLSAFFDLLYQDPVLGQVKLIAEAWDVGAPDSYQVGRFPAGWAEWNDHYRDTVRDFWRGAGRLGELGDRLTGSSDLYASDRRGPDASVNFITAHDGKTLTDLVTYEGKYNLANGENNRDGSGDDHASNYGVEGPTDDPQITALRHRQRRNMLATLLLSSGMPMLGGGDEIGRTQRGNNNAYCQDNSVSWYDWTASSDAHDLTAFTKRIIALRRSHPALRRRTFYTGLSNGRPLPDIGWYDLDGHPMTTQRWQDPTNHFIAFLLAGDGIDTFDPHGAPAHDEDILVVLNADTVPSQFTIPGRASVNYTVVVDTGQADGGPGTALWPVGQVTTIPARTVIVAAAATPPRPG
jgi:isoamylase